MKGHFREAVDHYQAALERYRAAATGRARPGSCTTSASSSTSCTTSSQRPATYREAIAAFEDAGDSLGAARALADARRAWRPSWARTTRRPSICSGPCRYSARRTTRLGEARALAARRRAQPPPRPADAGCRLLRTGPGHLPPHRLSGRHSGPALQPGRRQPAPGRIPAGHQLSPGGTRPVPADRQPVRRDPRHCAAWPKPCTAPTSPRPPAPSWRQRSGWQPKPATPTSRQAHTATSPRATTASATTSTPAITGSRHSPCTRSSAHPRQTRSGPGYLQPRGFELSNRPGTAHQRDDPRMLLCIAFPTACGDHTDQRWPCRLEDCRRPAGARMPSRKPQRTRPPLRGTERVCGRRTASQSPA